jgi:hypothetical protein
MGKIAHEYLSAINADLANGIATEHIYRHALKALLESLGDGRIVATNETKRIDVGAPDFDVSVKMDHGLLSATTNQRGGPWPCSIPRPEDETRPR